MSFLCALPVLASLVAGCAPPAPLAVGYVEGEYVLLAPNDIADVLTVGVRRGERVAAGQVLAELEGEDARIAVGQATAALDQAKAQLADLKLGKRAEEIAVIEATLASAEAQARAAEREYARTADLVKRGAATPAALDTAQTALELANAAVEQAKANVAVAHLPAREETIRAAENQVRQTEAALETAKWRLSKRSIVAQVGGRIGDVIRNPGDVAGPSAPVLSLLPDGAVKLKLYVGEGQFSGIEVGRKLAVRCDGCPGNLTAAVSYISPEPEFTPPVIYSLERRQKLVYLIEARPEANAEALQPGQLVDVVLREP
ncbi:MAG: HlyD family efflux transporter periplasmic adaptor subunit [Mesorhizobium sp.]|nr:HlyD family efflux transporter periplasmic adaptor subunit [Mesorhizobium sp.]MCO5161221.1 HlyD family efflux transporter periplasmic adaptor subunit [Mesorhizobium sp.]